MTATRKKILKREARKIYPPEAAIFWLDGAEWADKNPKLKTDNKFNHRKAISALLGVIASVIFLNIFSYVALMKPMIGVICCIVILILGVYWGAGSD